MRNALAAIAVGAAVGLSTDTMAASLRRFKGVRRRMQHRGTVRGVAVYDDFAHHPTAIGETLAGVRSAFPERRIWAIFEPRSATSCRRVFQADFARALSKGGSGRFCRRCSARRCPKPSASRSRSWSTDLKARQVDARYIPSTDEIVDAVSREGREGDLVIIMSNGGFDDIHQKLLTALERQG